MGIIRYFNKQQKLYLLLLLFSSASYMDKIKIKVVLHKNVEEVNIYDMNRILSSDN